MVNGVPRTLVLSVTLWTKFKPIAIVACHSNTKVPTAYSREKIDKLNSYMLCGHDEIAFILSIFIINQDNNFGLAANLLKLLQSSIMPSVHSTLGSDT